MAVPEFWTLGHIERMKKSVSIILVVAFAVFAIVDCIHDFISSDGLHYFSEQPHRLLFVALIGIIGGLVTFGFLALSPGVRRVVRLFVLGSFAGFVMASGGYFTYLLFQLYQLPPHTLAFPSHVLWSIVLGTVAVAGLLWFEFYQVLMSRNRVA